ncbi:putative glycoside hydrolase, family 27 [Lupinus albus]|uniref:Putative glycoside hydrolase, family 27 n=1 Tax=Lupinus albus TaxID=3870 RepID=A0A6A4QV27_LUPAL|nr:putative glycoside hydrolase, family 27 [Lupinus albus]
MISRADMNEVYADLARPGGWNDPDMFEVGNGGMNMLFTSVYGLFLSISTFSFCFLCKLMFPLLLGCDIRNITKETKEIVTKSIWAGPLSGYRVVAVVMLSRGPLRNSITASWDDIGIPPKKCC